MRNGAAVSGAGFPPPAAAVAAVAAVGRIAAPKISRLALSKSAHINLIFRINFSFRPSRGILDRQTRTLSLDAVPPDLLPVGIKINPQNNGRNLYRKYTPISLQSSMLGLCDQPGGELRRTNCIALLR